MALAYRLRRDFSLKLRRDADRLSCFQPVACAGALAVHANLPGAKHLLQRAVTQRGIMALEPAVEADASLLFVHLRGRAHAKARTSQSPANKAPTESATDATT